MVKFFQAGGHYLVGLAGIGAVTALAAIGTIAGGVAVPVITAIVTSLVGGGLVHNATAKTTTSG